MATHNSPSSHRPSNSHHREARRAVEEHERVLRTRAPGASSKRKRSTPFWKRVRWLAFVLLLIGAGQLVAASLSSPDFRVAQVTVSGAQISDADKVLEAQQKLVGQNWIRAQTGATIKELSALPTVQSVSVSRALHWPPQMQIAIVERAPFVRVGAGQVWWVADENGVPFRRAQKSEDDESLFAITNPKFAPSLGKPLPKEQWQPAFQLASLLNAQKQSWPLRRVYFDKNGFASLRIKDGKHDEMLIRLGGDRWREKLDRARVALAYFDRTNQGASTLNLVSYMMPQWTPIHPAATASTPAQATIAPDA